MPSFSVLNQMENNEKISLSCLSLKTYLSNLHRDGQNDWRWSIRNIKVRQPGSPIQRWLVRKCREARSVFMQKILIYLLNQFCSSLRPPWWKFYRTKSLLESLGQMRKKNWRRLAIPQIFWEYFREGLLKYRTKRNTTRRWIV